MENTTKTAYTSYLKVTMFHELGQSQCLFIMFGYGKVKPLRQYEMSKLFLGQKLNIYTTNALKIHPFVWLIVAVILYAGLTFTSMDIAGNLVCN